MRIYFKSPLACSMHFKGGCYFLLQLVVFLKSDFKADKTLPYIQTYITEDSHTRALQPSTPAHPNQPNQHPPTHTYPKPTRPPMPTKLPLTVLTNSTRTASTTKRTAYQCLTIHRWRFAKDSSLSKSFRSVAKGPEGSTWEKEGILFCYTCFLYVIFD